jgi:hypothetical protein
MHNYQIYLETETLSDGSMVHNVRLGEVVYHAVSRLAADCLARAFSEAINAYTVDISTINEEW